LQVKKFPPTTFEVWRLRFRSVVGWDRIAGNGNGNGNGNSNSNGNGNGNGKDQGSRIKQLIDVQFLFNNNNNNKSVFGDGKGNGNSNYSGIDSGRDRVGPIERWTGRTSNPSNVEPIAASGSLLLHFIQRDIWQK